MTVSRRIFLAAASLQLGLAAVEALAAKAPAKRSLMPALFLGHGSPMNAIADSEFTRALQLLGESLPPPRAILAVSAHWLTEGQTAVLGVERPQTIHDFGGFPDELHSIRYPAAGHPGLAARTAALIKGGAVRGDWGLDHGTWSVLRHVYPQANIPVFQLSIDMTKPGAYHLAVGKAIAGLREQGVLIMGSGNIVHNLRRTQRLPESANASQAWAQEFDGAVQGALSQREDARLASYASLPSAQLAVPTPDHYWPLMYVLGAASRAGPPETIYQSFQAGTISMRCLQFRG